MNITLAITDGTSDHPLSGTLTIDGVVIHNVVSFKFNDKHQEAVVWVKIPDLASGKMEMKEFVLPADKEKLICISWKLFELSAALGGIIGDTGTGSKT